MKSEIVWIFCVMSSKEGRNAWHLRCNCTINWCVRLTNLQIDPLATEWKMSTIAEFTQNNWKWNVIQDWIEREREISGILNGQFTVCACQNTVQLRSAMAAAPVSMAKRIANNQKRNEDKLHALQWHTPYGDRCFNNFIIGISSHLMRIFSNNQRCVSIGEMRQRSTFTLSS